MGTGAVNLRQNVDKLSTMKKSEIPWSEFYHVYPTGDFQEHNLEFTENPNCFCNPRVDVENQLVIHDNIINPEENQDKTIVYPYHVKRLSDMFSR